MATLQTSSSGVETKCYLGPFGRFIPVELSRPTWLRDTSPTRTPQRRPRCPKSDPPEKPTGLQFGSDTSLLVTTESQSRDESTPSPVHSMGSDEPELEPPRKRQALEQLPTSASCYASSLSDWSAGPSRTASPEDASSACGQNLTNHTLDPPTSCPILPGKEYTIPYSSPAIAPNDPSDISMALFMNSPENETIPFPPMDFDLGGFDYTKSGIFTPGCVDQSSAHYHQSRLPYIPGLGTGQAAVSTSSELSNHDDSLPMPPVSVPEQKHLAYVVEEREVEGEGICYIYSDGSHCPKYRNGELVNANWGITKAGKPRKRLAQACLTCRSKKIKCIPNFPKCDQCRRSGRNCRYENAVRRNSSKSRGRESFSSQRKTSNHLLPPFDMQDSYMSNSEAIATDFFAGRTQDIMASPTSYPDPTIYTQAGL